MDIYQIWTTYNRQWSRYEILAFAGVLILVCTAMAVCVHRKKLSIIQAVAVLALVLLLPAGVLLPIIANHKIKWYQALAVGILVSAIIEFSQLIFMRGLFEWDDMIHNGLGCMIGCLFANIFRKKKNRD